MKSTNIHQQSTNTFFQGKKVFVTGHTGFKGSWLCLWLQQLGAEVTGYALAPPTNPSLFEVANVAQNMHSIIGDIRDGAALIGAMKHATQTQSVRSVVNVTSDKCYENKEWVWGYRESEPMGGFDPYSNSKGCAELVTSAYRNSFFNPAKYSEHRVAIATGRAGNVIGGGDWAEDRLIPDILKAISENRPVIIRNPNAIRPWQHVLEPLSGYLVLAQRLYEQGVDYAEGWNFGPKDEDAQPVQWIVERLTQEWGDGATWQLDGGDHPHEAHYLKLDCSKAKMRLDWQPRWGLAHTLEMIVVWQRAYLAQADMRQMTLNQISKFTTREI
jgi:CDP-glucose 4,6-dehydratase